QKPREVVDADGARQTHDRRRPVSEIDLGFPPRVFAEGLVKLLLGHGEPLLARGSLPRRLAPCGRTTSSAAGGADASLTHKKPICPAGLRQRLVRPASRRRGLPFHRQGLGSCSSNLPTLRSTLREAVGRPSDPVLIRTRSGDR